MDEQLKSSKPECVPECKCTCTGKLSGEKTIAVTNIVHVKAKDMCEPNGDCAEEDLTIKKRYTLIIVKSVCPGIAEPGDTIVYTITVTNESNSTMAAENVVITDNVPSEINITSVTTSMGTVNSATNPIKVTIPVLGIGETATIKIKGTIK